MSPAAVLLLLLACASFALPAEAQREHTLTGYFRTHPAFHSAFLKQDRNVIVWLPPDYEASPRRRYPVFYLCDGQNVFDGATSFLPGKEWRLDETSQRMTQSGEMEPAILVGVYNSPDRISEYTPTYLERFKQGGKADDYGRMLIEELKPFIDAHYRTRRTGRDTGLGGSSLGGLLALYLGLKHPRVFQRLAVVSPSVWWDNRVIVRMVEALKRRPALRIWLDVGTAEGGNAQEADETLQDARALHAALLNRGWKPGRDLAWLEVEGAHHNEDAWAARADKMLAFLFPPASARPGKLAP